MIGDCVLIFACVVDGYGVAFVDPKFKGNFTGRISHRFLSFNSTQLNSTQLNSTQLNSTQLNSTQLNSTQLNSLSCDPNCVTTVVSSGGKYVIGVYAIRPIAKGEEITFDYLCRTDNEEELKAAICLWYVCIWLGFSSTLSLPLSLC